jgi:hypothetical protein
MNQLLLQLNFINVLLVYKLDIFNNQKVIYLCKKILIILFEKINVMF